MSAGPFLPRSHVGTIILAAAVSALIATGLLGAVAGLFQRDGAPLEHIVVAERACANHTFVSEREACKRSFPAASQVRSVASR